MKITQPKAEGAYIPGDPFVYCQMTGFKCRYSDTVIQWDGRRVHKDWADPKPLDSRFVRPRPFEMKAFPATGFNPRVRYVSDQPSVNPNDEPTGQYTEYS